MAPVIRIFVFGVILSSLVGCATDNRSLDQSTLKRIERLEQQVSLAADKQAIHDVLNRYARALDRRDADRLDRVFLMMRKSITVFLRERGSSLNRS